MKFSDIPAKALNLRIKRTDGNATPLPAHQVISIVPCSTRPGEFDLHLKDSVVIVKPISATDDRRLNSELATGCAVLAQLANPASDGSIELQAVFFAQDCREMGSVEIGADEYVEQAYAAVARSRDQLSGKLLYEALANRCCYYHGGEFYFFFYAGPAVDNDIYPEPDGSVRKETELIDDAEQSVDGNNNLESQVNPTLELSPHRPHPTNKNSFCVVGDGIRFLATETMRPDGSKIYIVSKLTKVKGKPDRALQLAKGKLTFSDWTQAGQIQILTKAQISALTRDEGSYLKRWDEFVEIEGELVFERARRIGVLLYGDMEPKRDGIVTVRITESSDSALEALANDNVESLEITDDIPEYLSNREFTFTNFSNSIENEAKAEAIIGKYKDRRNEGNLRCELLDYDPVTRTISLKTEHNLPSSGTMILSLAGQIAQIKRRLSARRAIVEGRSANSQLGLLIEKKGELAPARVPNKIKPLTAFVENKVFDNPPTEKQRDAISIALNTPDIALIQGPPGTGKTTVIAAIIERLNEMADKRGSNQKGSVLLTGFQHDAVANMINRLALNGLPVPKFGRKSGSNENEFSVFERKLQDWCNKRAEELRAKNPCLAEIEQETQIRNLCLQYMKLPTRALALNIAKKISNLDIIVIGDACSRRAANIAKRLALEERLTVENDPILKTVRRLRHRPEAFYDDGPERSADALDELNEFLDADDRSILELASLWRKEDGAPQFLDKIAALKKRLLSRFTIPPVFRIEKRIDEVVELVEETLKKLLDSGISSKDAKSSALAEFLAELEGNPYGMMDAVSDYAYAFAATCQQSVNKQMQLKKGIISNETVPEIRTFSYDYVVVDEAARVTPPDLMIAMAQGKRIILVGDHRQLPHIIDEAVAEQMESGAPGRDEEEWLKKSMFQYLFSDRIPSLEAADKITRRVTLDMQYRMHPLLGDFVSRNFYERFNPSERFGSGRPEADFYHNLPATDGRPAIWLNVPSGKGKQKREGTSWTRPAESIAIARLVLEWMKCEEGKGLTFGVISFYKAQAELIKKQVGKDALNEMIRNKNGETEFRLRVGTVDSFQGMEFDVVFLSMVRTMPDHLKESADDDTIRARKLFGHLCLYNRLNVSMSRQKKLLVVAGDPDLLNNNLASTHVSGLCDFYNLCKQHGKII